METLDWYSRCVFPNWRMIVRLAEIANLSFIREYFLYPRRTMLVLDPNGHDRKFWTTCPLRNFKNTNPANLNLLKFYKSSNCFHFDFWNFSEPPPQPVLTFWNFTKTSTRPILTFWNFYKGSRHLHCEATKFHGHTWQPKNQNILLCKPWILYSHDTSWPHEYHLVTGNTLFNQIMWTD